LKIFNRWGKVVHEGSGENHAWDGMVDGELAPSDVYFFIFEISNAETGEIEVVSKDLTLVR